MKKKTCVKIISLLTAGILLMTACNQVDDDSDTELKNGQTLKYAQIVTINGNEATLAWATATSSEDATVSEDQTRGDFQENMGSSSGTASSNENESAASETQADGDSNTSNDQNSNSTGQMQMPGGSDSSGGQMPGGSDSSGGQMPGGSDSSGGQMPGGDMSGDSSESNSDQNNRSERTEKETEATMIYTLTGDQDTMYIPVGTTVTTELGATTTFSRLAAGDMLKIIFEEDSSGNDVIVSIDIVE